MDKDEIPLDPEEVPLYSVDDATLELIEVALNCMVTLSESQLHEDARENLVTIADEIALRFGISAGVIETTTEDDGETILRPRGGIFNDEDDEDNNPSKLGPSLN